MAIACGDSCPPVCAAGLAGPTHRYRSEFSTRSLFCRPGRENREGAGRVQPSCLFTELVGLRPEVETPARVVTWDLLFTPLPGVGRTPHLYLMPRWCWFPELRPGTLVLEEAGHLVGAEHPGVATFLVGGGVEGVVLVLRKGS